MSQDIFGWIGGTLIVITNLPQLHKLYKTKSGEDISFYTVLLGIIGSIFMGTYGFVINSIPLIICNILITLIMLAILFLKNKFKNRNDSIIKSTSI